MNTLRRRGPTDRSRSGRKPPRFERLEPRVALSTASIGPLTGEISPTGPSVVSVVPAPASHLDQAPPSIAVTFDRPLAGAPVAGDFRLELVSADGTVTTADEGSSLAEAVGANPWSVVLTPGQPLGPGHYRLELLGTSPLAGASGSDRVIDDFTVGTTMAVSGPAIDLGSPISTVVGASGTLDPAANPVAFYTVELPAGHFWRLGVEVDAQAIGSPLTSSLVVYDAQGHAVATDDRWGAAAPLDPYLYVGLNPGVYYVAVAIRSGLPAGVAPSGGAFRLGVVADPADAPTAIASATVDHADPTSAVATGLTLGFDGPLDPSALAGHAAGLVEVVDASGRAFSVDATSYDSGTSRLSLAFDQPLPAGHYQVVLVGQGGLVDLIGRPPVAPGLPAGTLATFDVPAASALKDPGDYGPIFLSDLLQGLSARLQLGPNQEATYRFVLTGSGFYDLATTFGGSAPTFTAYVGGRAVGLGAGAQGVATAHVVRLGPGVVTLDVKAGPTGTTIDWAFLLKTGSYDLLLDNGVGQASGLGLRLVAPSSSPSPTGPSAAPTPDVSAVVAAPSASPGPSFAASPATPTSTGAGLVAAALPVGHPSTLDDAVAVVGPVAPGGMAALSSSAAGIPQGLAIGSSALGSGATNSGAIAGLIAVPEPEASDAGADPATAAAETTALTELPPMPADAGQGTEPSAPARGDGLVGWVSAVLAGLIPSRRLVPPRAEPTSLDDLALAAVDGAQAALPDDPGAVESADLTTPMGAALVVVAAAHYRRRLAGWLARRKAPAALIRGSAAGSAPDRPGTGSPGPTDRRSRG